MEALPLNAVDLTGWVSALVGLSVEAGDGERIDRIRVLEELKGAIAAAQAREAVALKRSVIAAEAAQGVPADQQGRGVAAQVALARRESPHRGGRLLGLAEALVKELPHTLALLSRGQVSEWRATLVCRETACLSRADRGRVDQLLATTLPSLSDRQVIAQARRHSYRLDPASFVERCAKAETDRRVSIRPAPNAMALISALLPVSQGVATYAALVRAADSARASGDPRSRGQVMADTLITRVTGQTQAEQVPVEVQLVISADSLLHGDPEAATIPGYGPVPAGHALRILRNIRTSTPAWVRRLYANPATGQLVAMETSRRLFPKPMRRFLTARDQLCRTPWCGAPIRHTDHITPAHQSGPTSLHNGQGLCERCNQLKENPGWHSITAGEGIITTTPTGHRYRSTSPPLTEPQPKTRAHIIFPGTPRAA